MMRSKKNICFVTGSRAEYGLLLPLLKKIKSNQSCNLQIVATCMHLSPEFGLTYREIEKDGFRINEKVEMLLSSDSSIGISKSMGLGFIGLAESYSRLKPDILVLLGDRFETFIAAAVANIFRIPISHIHGGEITEGAYDEAFRHSITKMSTLHFTATEVYRQRVVQLGEHPNRVFNVGAIGLDNIETLHLLNKKQLEKKLGITFLGKNLLITFHSSTTQAGSAKQQCQEFLKALSQIDDTYLLFTKTNADTNGRIINALIEKFVAQKPFSRSVFTSLGSLYYLSLMKYVDAVVGNSSSGIIEAPSFKIGTINIGNRQKGRVKGKTIIDCAPRKVEILRAIHKLYSVDFQRNLKESFNPYYHGIATRSIYDELLNYLWSKKSLKKFYDLP
jgi:GDP/UDP-N,N'-diacetylbacillosamine 2-epimerase (hydrolysing)